ncbi:MAG TPA: hypothetical protein VE523_09110 [Solirubrobacterales bacterium]|nr:hypothetical protein [Solirubrobacterales bacterium]
MDEGGYRGGLTPALRLTLVGFAGLALIAGLLLFAGAGDTADWFSWTIEPPLSAAALGAFYWAAFVLLATGARAPDWDAARPIVLPVLVIAVVLLAVTLVHLDRFDMDSLFGVFWLCAYIAAPLLLLYGIAAERRSHTGEAQRSARRLPGGLRGVLAGEAVVMLAASGLMLLAPDTAADMWPWALTPLVSRALGAFTLGVALVGLMVVREDRLVLFSGTAVAYLALGALQLLAVALHGGDLGDDGPANALYVAFLAAILATGAYGAIAARASSRS